MQTISTQIIGTPIINYSKFQKTETKKPLQNGIKVSTKEEKDADRLEWIAFLTQYMEDLKAGKPVENISPSNDSYYLVPENIAALIRGEKDILAGRFRTIKSIKDIIGEWDIE